MIENILIQQKIALFYSGMLFGMLILMIILILIKLSHNHPKKAGLRK